MSKKSLSVRAFAVVALTVSTLFVSLPGHASPVRRPAASVAASGEGILSWVRSLLSRLGVGAVAKEGMSIDPDGIVRGDEGVSIDPNGVCGDEGVSIDPNG